MKNIKKTLLEDEKRQKCVMKRKNLCNFDIVKKIIMATPLNAGGARLYRYYPIKNATRKDGIVIAIRCYLILGCR